MDLFVASNNIWILEADLPRSPRRAAVNAADRVYPKTPESFSTPGSYRAHNYETQPHYRCFFWPIEEGVSSRRVRWIP